MVRLNIHEAKTHLSKYLQKMEKRGESIILCRRNVPIAEIRPLKRAALRKRPVGLAKGKARILPGFWEPLPDWMLDAFEGKAAE